LDVCTEGQFATIYRARPGDAAATEADVALKVVRRESLHDQLEVEAFADRVARAVALSDTAPHPAIVRVREHGAADGRAWAAMELVDGLSLDHLGSKRKRGCLPVEGAVVVLRELLEALAAASSCPNPTSHGRIGRSHILIDVDGSVRLIGFGAADRERQDLLAVGRLANQITTSWPGEIDAWIDKLTDGTDAFETVQDALDALPMGAFEVDVLAKGRKALAKAVVKERKRAEKAAAKAREAENDEAVDGSATGPEDADDSAPTRIPEASDIYPTLRQARGVMWACAAMFFVAVAIEVLRHGG